MITKPKSRWVRAKARDRRRARPGVALSRERIAAAALALVDREGLAGLSTRQLGDELGCEAMSVYHHFPSKAHLMDAVVDLMLTDARVAMAEEGDWLERLRRAAHGFRAMALKHPKFFPFFALHRLNTLAGVGYIDSIIGILRDAGFSDRDAARYFREIGYYRRSRYRTRPSPPISRTLRQRRHTSSPGISRRRSKLVWKCCWGDRTGTRSGKVGLRRDATRSWRKTFVERNVDFSYTVCITELLP